MITKEEKEKNWPNRTLTKSEPKQDTKKKQEDKRENNLKQRKQWGYNLMNEAKLWYQLIWTPWSHGHVTYTQERQILEAKESSLIEVWYRDYLN
jgi:hypothetical protein